MECCDRRMGVYYLYGVLKTIDSLVGLRVTPEEEIAGLDASEHGTSAYGDFILKK